MSLSVLCFATMSSISFCSSKVTVRSYSICGTRLIRVNPRPSVNRTNSGSILSPGSSGIRYTSSAAFTAPALRPIKMPSKMDGSVIRPFKSHFFMKAFSVGACPPAR